MICDSCKIEHIDLFGIEDNNYCIKCLTKITVKLRTLIDKIKKINSGLMTNGN